MISFKADKNGTASTAGAQLNLSEEFTTSVINKLRDKYEVDTLGGTSSSEGFYLILIRKMFYLLAFTTNLSHSFNANFQMEVKKFLCNQSIRFFGFNTFWNHW